MLEINEVEYCKVNVKYTADPAVVLEKTEEAIKQLKKLPVPGFRPGKATNLAIKARYKLKIEDWVKREMSNVAAEDCIFETKMQPIGAPQVLDLKFDGKNFNCEFLFLKKPDFELKEVKGLEIPKPHQATNQAGYVEKMLQELRVQHGDSIPYTDADFVQIGDVVTMDYKTSDAGEEGMLYTVGSNLLPEFDDNIVGMSAGETREFKLSINEKTDSVSATIHMGMKKVPCALDDSLAAKLGIENLNKLREVVEGVATNRLKQDSDSQIANQIKIRLLDMHSFEVPQFLLTMELQDIAKKANLTLDSLSDEEKEDLTTRAKDSIKFALILDSIRQKEPESDLSDQEVLNLIRQRVAGKVPNVEAFLMDMQNKGNLIGSIAQIRNEVALQFLIDNAKLVE